MISPEEENVVFKGAGVSFERCPELLGQSSIALPNATTGKNARKN